MMKRFRRPFLRRNLRKSPPSSSSFLSLLGSLNSLRDLIPSLLGSCLGRVCPPPLPPVLRLLPPPADVGWGRRFESFLLPSLPQVGGVLGWDWAAWSSDSAEVWAVEVLRLGYRYLISFHKGHFFGKVR